MLLGLFTFQPSNTSNLVTPPIFFYIPIYRQIQKPLKAMILQ